MRSQHSSSALISLHLTAVAPFLHVIHISTIDATRIQSLCTNSLVPMPSHSRSVTICCLDLRIPSSCPSHIHPPASCRIILMSFTCIPYMSANLDLHSKSARRFTAGRTSLHLLDPLQYLHRPRSPLSLPFLFLGF
jgi:hypothetical protein